MRRVPFRPFLDKERRVNKPGTLMPSHIINRATSVRCHRGSIHCSSMISIIRRTRLDKGYGLIPLITSISPLRDKKTMGLVRLPPRRREPNVDERRFEDVVHERSRTWSVVVSHMNKGYDNQSPILSFLLCNCSTFIHRDPLRARIPRFNDLSMCFIRISH